MSTPNRSKLNQLITENKRGIVFTSDFLGKKGYSNDLIKRYRRSGWLDAVGRGAYKIKHDKLDWIGGVFTLQNQLALSVHPGGKTALLLKGYSHYAKLRDHEVFLYGQPREKLPAWFREYDWGVAVTYRTSNLFPGSLKAGLLDFPDPGFTITISSPERAAFEMLNNVPVKQSFDEALKIMESLTTLRPDVVQDLLLHCNSVKVKRLFLYLAEYCRHHWFSRLNFDGINLGSGNREIYAGGQLDKKYKITVPKTIQEEIP